MKEWMTREWNKLQVKKQKFAWRNDALELRALVLLFPSLSNPAATACGIISLFNGFDE